MSKIQTLRSFVSQRLSAAAEEIFELFERTIAEYEEEPWRQRRLLDAAHRADVQQLLESKEEVPPEQQELSPSLDQEDPPGPPHIKEEQEELWTNQLGGPDEAENTMCTLTPAPVKSEDDDEEKPQTSQLQTEMSRDAEACGGSEPTRNFIPDSDSQPACDDKTSHSSEPGTDDSSCDWDESREPQSGLNSVHNSEVCDVESNPGKTSSRAPECSSSSGHNGQQLEGKRFGCSICEETFQWRRDIWFHITTHTREKPFSCSVCGKGFARNSNLTAHFKVHTGEKPFACSVCKASFHFRCTLAKHLKTHTGERPFLMREKIHADR